MKLSTPVEKIPRVGAQYTKKLKRLGIENVRDLLFHFPHRYEDFSDLVPIAQVKIGEKVCIQGEIKNIENTRTWRRRMTVTTALVEDKSGAVKVIWFNQPYLEDTLKPGTTVCLAGKVAAGKKSYPGVYLSSPTYEKISKKESQDFTHTGRIIPIYPETEGLSSRWLRYIIKPLLASFADVLPDPLPDRVVKENNLITLKESLWQIHFPDSLKKAERSRERFSFQELFLVQLYVLKERMKLKKQKAVAVPIHLETVKKFVASLPFTLTDAQKKCSWQILKDMEKPRPMNRMLEGDVGSGKTVVAVMAMLNTMKEGRQTAFMAPTEILSKQHFASLSELLKGLGVSIGLLTGQESRVGSRKISREKFLEKAREGKLDILVGTHALIQKGVKFGNLSLVVLDEQHRFGVEQRAKLCQEQGSIPHLLSMTATPIPRTLALTLYGDLDLSLLDEMPKGRKKIITKLIPPQKRKEVYDFVKEEIKKGRQAFVICPRIEADNGKESWAEVKAVEEEYEKLSRKVFPGLSIAKLHGRMKPQEKEKIMERFKNKKDDILVSTSVVEVGIDVPNATMMVIEGAERFGLSQLHQFRGRVGRGKEQSFCFLFTDSAAKRTSQRLKALMDSKTGFELAEKDLEIRGPGEVFGTRQSGIPDLATTSLSDIFLVEKTRNWAKEILQESPALDSYPVLKSAVKEFTKKIHLE